MKTTFRNSLAAALSLAALSLWLAPGAPAAGVHFTPESLQTAQGQINANQVHAASFNKKAHTLHLTLNDGRHVLASYPSHSEPQLAAQLQAHGVTPVIKKAKKKKAAHHRLRYIAGGVLIVVIVIVALVLGLNRRRPREDAGAGGAGAAGAAGTGPGAGAAPGAGTAAGTGVAPGAGTGPAAPPAPEEPPAQ